MASYKASTLSDPTHADTVNFSCIHGEYDDDAVRNTQVHAAASD